MNLESRADARHGTLEAAFLSMFEFHFVRYGWKVSRETAGVLSSRLRRSFTEEGMVVVRRLFNDTVSSVCGLLGNVVHSRARAEAVHNPGSL